MNLLENVYFQTTVKLLLIVYASAIAPRLPEGVIEFMQTTPMRIIFLAGITYFALAGDLQMSLLLACALVLSVNVLSGRGLLESYMNLGDAFSGAKNPQSLIEPSFFIYPGCVDMKYQDLLEFFEGDAHKLQEAIHYVFKRLDKEPKGTAEETLIKYARAAGIPHNIAFNDDNAPLIATMLMNYGYKLNDKCLPPQ